MLRVVDDANLSIRMQGLPVWAAYIRRKLPSCNFLLVLGSREIQWQEQLIDTHIGAINAEDDHVNRRSMLLEETAQGACVGAASSFQIPWENSPYDPHPVPYDRMPMPYALALGIDPTGDGFRRGVHPLPVGLFIIN